MNNYITPSPQLTAGIHYVYPSLYQPWPLNYPVSDILPSLPYSERTLNSNNVKQDIQKKSLKNLISYYPTFQDKQVDTPLTSFLQGAKIALAPSIFFGLYSLVTSIPILGGCRSFSQVICRSLLLVLTGAGLGGLFNSPEILQTLLKKIRKDKNP